MFRRLRLVRSLSLLDIPAALLSDNLPAILPGKDRYGFHAILMVLMALSASAGSDSASALRFLELSESVVDNLYTQRMCRIWLSFLDDMSKETEAGPDIPANQADQAIAELLSLLETENGGSYARRILHPVQAADWIVARKWMPFLALAVSSQRSTMPEDVFARCTDAYKACRAMTLSTEIVDRLYFPVRYIHALQRGDQAETGAIALEWAAFRLRSGSGDASRFMMMNLQRLESGAAPEEALAVCVSYRDMLPEDYDLIVAQARMQRRMGNFSGCLETCGQAIALRPDAYAAYCVRSNLRFLTEEYALARADADQACRLAPEKAQGFIARAFVQLHEGEYERSLDDFETALKLDPLRMDAMHGKGKCLSLLGEDEQAMTCFNRLRRMLPEDPDIAYELADAMFAAGFLDDALRVCRECLALEEDYSEAYVLMAVVETRRENDGRAFAYLERALEIESDNPFALNEMAYLLHLQGRDGEAFDYVEQALDSFPDFTEALYNKATILFFQGLLDESFDLYERILQSIPEHVSALIGKANVLTQMSELEEALDCFDAALRIFPKSSEACLGKATVYRMMGLEEDGREWQEKARRLEQDPS